MTPGEALVGRTEEMAALDRALSGPGPGFVVVTGEPGIGKSALLGAAAERARAAGHLVLRATPTEAEREAEHGVLGDLTRPLLESSEDPTQVRPSAVGFHDAVRRRAVAQRVVVVVDDAQWVDAASADALAWAGRRLGEVEVALLFASRLAETTGFPWTARAPDVDPVHIHPRSLTMAETAELLDRVLDLRPDRLTTGRIHDQAAGNPLWILELGRAVLNRGDVTGRTSSLLGLVANRLAVLPERHERFLLAAALAHVPTPRTIVDAGKGSDLDLRLFVDDPGVTALVGLQDGLVRFLHPLYAAAVSARADPGTTATMHRRLADCDAPRARLVHLARAAASVDEDLAHELDDAARDAAARGALTSALELEEHAARLTPVDSPDRLPRVLRRAQWAVRVGLHDVAAELVGELITRLEHPAGQQGLLIWAYLGGLVSEGEVLRRLDQIISAPGASPLTVAAALLRRAATTADVGAMADDLARATSLVACHPGHDRELDARMAAVRAQLALLRGESDHLDRMREAAELEEDLPLVEPTGARASLVQHLVALDRFPEARDRARDLLAAARHAGDETMELFVLVQLAHLETRAGRWEVADGYTVDARRLALIAGDRPVLALLEVHLAATSGLRGDLGLADHHCDAALRIADELDLDFTRAVALAARGRTLQGFGRLAEALDAFTASADAWSRTPLDAAVYNHFALDRAECLVGLGRTAEAASLMETVAGGATTERLRSALDRCRAQVAAGAGNLEEAARLAEQAHAELAELELPLERGRALLVLGRVHRRARAKRAAHDALRAALAQFEELGAAGWAVQTREDLARIGIRPRAPERLTETEEQVADLAAQGLTNREISEALFVAPKTVESVLSRVFRKLQVRGRAELGRALAAREHH